MFLWKWLAAGTQQQTSPTSITNEVITEKYFGLENFGNTCYCNAVLQSLYFCRPFRDLVITSSSNNFAAEQELKELKKYEQTLNSPVISPSLTKQQSSLSIQTNFSLPSPILQPKKPSLEDLQDSSEDKSLLYCLKELFVNIYKQKKKTGYITPKAFVTRLRQENELFKAPIHHDAHEFFNYLLNAISDILIKQKSQLDQLEEQKEKLLQIKSNSPLLTPQTAFPLSSLPTPTQAKPKINFQELKNTLENYLPQTWIHELFEGILSNETKCLTCNTVTTRLEPFLDLSLDIPSDNCSLTKCLHNFVLPEMLRDQNKFFCDHCAGLQDAVKRMRIRKLPRILALHLKRFKFLERRQQHIKLSHRVSFPFELSLSAIKTPEAHDKLYRLFSVIIHIGSGPSHGHYVSVVKSHGKWLLFDDTTVEEIDETILAKVFGHSYFLPTGEHVKDDPSDYPKRGYGTMDGFPSNTTSPITENTEPEDKEILKSSRNSLQKSVEGFLSQGSGYILFYEQ